MMAENAEQSRAQTMEDELKKMLESKPRQVVPDMKNTREIEADLKRMLNMQPSKESGSSRDDNHDNDSQHNRQSPNKSSYKQDSQIASASAVQGSHGVVVTKEDLQNLSSSKANSQSPHNNERVIKSSHHKRRRKGKHTDDEEHPAVHHHHRQHLEDPPITVPINPDDESQIAVPKKKKKKKPKKPKNRGKDDSLTEQDHTLTDTDSEVENDVKEMPDLRLLEFQRTRYLDDKLTFPVLMELEEERIYPLKKKSSAFAHAKYFCRLCDYHCDTIPVCRQHADDARHRRRKEIMVQDQMLKNLPTPSQRHVAALDDLVEDIYLTHGLTDEELTYRLQTCSNIQKDLNKSIPSIELNAFGSSVTSFGLKDADLNMDLVAPKGENSARYLVQVLRILTEMTEYSNVKSDFLAKVPSVKFVSPCGTLQCQITIGCELSVYTSRYLAIYAKHDSRLRKLAVVFKYWAKICQLDDQIGGSLPAYCYGIMTVYFLQQIKHPILPVFWKDLTEEALKRPQRTSDILNLLSEFEQLTWKAHNTDSVGTLWKDLLMFYGVNFNIADHVICIRSKKLLFRSAKKWKSKRLAIEDPFMHKRNVARSLQNLRMFDYFYNCLRKAGLYYSLPTSHQEVLQTHKTLKHVLETKHKSQNKEVSTQASDVNKSLVVTNKNVKKLTDSSRLSANSEGKPMERDSFCEGESVSTSAKLGHGSDTQSSEKSVICTGADELDNDSVESNSEAKRFAEEFVEKVLSDAVRELNIRDTNVAENSSSSDKRGDKQVNKNEKLDIESGASSASENEQENGRNENSRERTEVRSPVGAEYVYKFDATTLTDGKGPSVICCVCDKEGHLKVNCPEDDLPKLVDLAPLPKTHIMKLTQVIKQVPKDFKLSYKENNDRECIRKDLENHIQSLYPDAQLVLFGSSKNGFGFHQSDLDICVTFKGKKAEDVNFVEHIEAICKKLKGHRSLYGVFPITTAKVPIVKFTHRPTQLEADISMYNVLAMQNTKLLSTYASIDARVQTLGYAIKVFAKVCDIGDASRGSLSSYAYMLMMLHYLQHTKPPIIPVLQELRYSDDPNPEFMVEGWNTWFFDNLDDLPLMWSGCGKNSQSVGELWFGFFRYYLEEFSFLEQVVTIRQFQPLLKFEKLWNGKCIAIEDPFDLDHNLGGALSRRMNQYIQRTFVHARELYGTPFDQLPATFDKIEDYFFDKGHLVDGDPPSDRLCRVCSKIGHIAKECPILIARKERGEAERKRRDELKKQEGAITPGKNSGPRHQNNRNNERQGTSRSLSDPSSEDSPRKGPVRGQVYQRQHSQPDSQSPDKRHIQGLRHESYNQGSYGSPRSPHQDYQRPYSPNRRSQNYNTGTPRSPQSKNPPNYGYRQQQQVYSNQQFQYNNRNENNPRPAYNQGHGQAANRNQGQGQGQTSNRSGGPLLATPNYEPRQQQRSYSQGDSHHYPSSPRNQQPAAYKSHPTQVYIDPNMFVGYQRCFTNQVYNSPNNVIPNVSMFVNPSMTDGQVFPYATNQMVQNIPNPGVNVDMQLNSGPPVCMPSRYDTQVLASARSFQDPLVTHDSGVESDVNPKMEHSIWNTNQYGRHVESPNNPSRTVNMQKTGRNQALPDFGKVSEGFKNMGSQ